MSKNRLRNRTELNRAKNRLSATSAQPTGPTACPDRVPCRALSALTPRAAQRPARREPDACARAPRAHFRFCIFFFFLFFSFLSATGKYQKKYFYLFSFIFQYNNKFIKIYFIYIIYIFFPTNQINCLNLFYLFSCSSLHIVNSKVCFPTSLCAIYLSTQTFTSHIQHVIHTKHIHTNIHQST